MESVNLVFAHKSLQAQGNGLRHTLAACWISCLFVQDAAQEKTVNILNMLPFFPELTFPVGNQGSRVEMFLCCPIRFHPRLWGWLTDIFCHCVALLQQTLLCAEQWSQVENVTSLSSWPSSLVTPTSLVGARLSSWWRVFPIQIQR